MSVLVTRPKLGAMRTAKRVQEMGLTPLVLPLSKTVGLPVNEAALKGEALIITSEAVFEHMEPRLLQSLKHKDLYCVGPRTAQIAEKFGFDTIKIIASTAEKLVASIDCSQEIHFLYLAGRVRGPDLENELLMTHKNLTVIEIYDTFPLQLTLQEKQKFTQKIKIIMLYSALAAKSLEQISSFLNPSTALLCLSQRIANAIPVRLCNPTIIAYEPNEEAMLKGLATFLRDKAFD
ncbi:hypothetical protein MEG_01640 [Bartonella tamiae Th307]|uniref:Tetrapyrrole biosynthesis uroporphyrinogen III synthase domain-containing protein n=2 Tax=Bartonella tamiae TaxID=373638 RepID=J0QZH3_9HYPH|nr:hypothetical protein ME5_00241 [Bartonella tamiae Th239]EJF92470.1 hypothetical protein MEG_01640 [Bartonella tamiae Th307]